VTGDRKLFEQVPAEKPVMTACPSPDKWQQYIRDELGAEEDNALIEHVDTCRACEEQLSALLRPGIASFERLEAPPDLVERLCRLWPAFPREDPTQEKHWPKIDGYEILGVLGQGGMGVVYRAWDEQLQRAVALKMIATVGAARAADATRLVHDARTAAGLKHPGIVPVYAVGEHQGLPFCVMELVEGGSLAQRVTDLVVAPEQTARLVAQAARALHYAHNENVCHRDVKSANVLLRVRDDRSELENVDSEIIPGAPRLEECDACVADFGLARRMQEASGTPESNILGTPGYIAPEQLRQERPSPAADIFALGAVLYECLTGQQPFQGATRVDTLLLTLEKEPERPRLLNARVARDLETICLKCLEKEPPRRYATAGALADDLERWLRGEPVHARRVGPVGRAWQWCRRKPMIAGLTGLLMLAVAGGSVTSLLLWRRAVAGEKRAQEKTAEAYVSLGQAETERQQAETARQQAEAAREQAEAARRETEDSYVRLSSVLNRTMSWAGRSPLVDATAEQEDVLTQAERDLKFILDRHGSDDMKYLYARVLFQLGAFHFLRHRDEAERVLDKAAGLWRELAAKGPDDLVILSWYAICCFMSERVHHRLGHNDRAQAFFDEGFQAWVALTRKDPRGAVGELDAVLPFNQEIAWVLIRAGSSSDLDFEERLRTVRSHLRRADGTGEVFFHLVQFGNLYWEARKHHPTGTRPPSLPECRQAASVLSGLISRADLEDSLRLHLAWMALQQSIDLRRGQALDDAMSLMRQTKRMLQEVLSQSPDKATILSGLSLVWRQISKVYWEMGQVNETLNACHQAIETARQAMRLEPDRADYREYLMDRYLRLGRKLCESGRLDEAESCFRERETLWLPKTGKETDAVAQIRGWADRVGKDRNNLSPEERRERDRYLELAARLEGKGGAKLSTTGGLGREVQGQARPK
jgi:tetratricopeptide (TPR) repeat protein/tRNA A-37 threonylcarbamoyl transferase component Bud32